MKNRLSIDQFDGGIGTSTRTNPSASFAYIKGDVSKDPTTVYPSKTIEAKNTNTDLAIQSIGYVDTVETICGVGKGFSNWLTKSATHRISVTNKQWAGANRFPISATTEGWHEYNGAVSVVTGPDGNANSAIQISGVSSSAADAACPFGYYLETNKIVLYYDPSGMGSGHDFDFTIGNASATYNESSSTWTGLLNITQDSDAVYSGTWRKAIFTYTGATITSRANYVVRFDYNFINAGNIKIALQFTDDTGDAYVPTTGNPTFSNTIGSTNFYWYDLANVPSGFWNLVNSTGGNVVPTDSTHAPITDWKYLYFDQPTSEGVIITDTEIAYLYILPNYNEGDSAFTSIVDSAYSMFRFDGNVTDDLGNLTSPSGTPSYTTGVYGQALTNTTLLNSGQANFWNEDEGYFVFDLYVPSSSTASSTSIINDGAGQDFNITFSAGGGVFGQIDIGLYIRGTSAVIGASFSAPTAFGSVYGYDKWHRIAVTFNSGGGVGDVRMYGNDQLIREDTTDWGVFNSPGTQIYIEIPADHRLDNLLLNETADSSSGARFQNQYYMLHVDDYWTYGALETNASVTKTYGGVQLYYYDVATNTWEDHFDDRFIVRRTDWFPYYGTIFDSSRYIYFPVDSTGGGLINYYAMFDYGLGTITWNKSSLVTTTSQKVKSEKLGFASSEVVAAIGSSNTAVDSFSGSTVTTADYGTGFRIDAMALYRRYFVAAGDNENYSYATDTVDTLTTTFNSYNIGSGNVKLMHAPFGKLLGVVDGFINDSGVSKSPFLAVRMLGADSIDVVALDVETNETARTMPYNGAISPCKGLSRNGFIFWGDLTFDGSTHTGLYQVSVNQLTQVSSLTYLTDFSAEPVDMANIGDTLYILDTSGNTHSYSTTDDEVELHTNFIGVDRGNVKVVQSVQATTSEAGGVTVYSRILGGAWVPQGSTTSETRHEVLVDVPENGETQFRVVSTKPLTGINIVYSQSNND